MRERRLFDAMTCLSEDSVQGTVSGSMKRPISNQVGHDFVVGPTCHMNLDRDYIN